MTIPAAILVMLLVLQTALPPPGPHPPAGQRPPGAPRIAGWGPVPNPPPIRTQPSHRPSSSQPLTVLLTQIPIWIFIVMNARRQQQLRAERLRIMAEEEQDKTPYSEEELMQDYEFKIVRNELNLFDQPELLAEALRREADAGWQLVEKFDGNRLRLKRPASWRDDGPAPGIDPYRTNVLPEATHAAQAAKRAKDLRIFGYIVSGCIAAALVLGVIWAALPQQPELPRILTGVLAIVAGVLAIIFFIATIARSCSK